MPMTSPSSCGWRYSIRSESQWRIIDWPSSGVTHTRGEYGACRIRDAYSSSCRARSASPMRWRGVASSTVPIRLTGVTQAAALIRVMIWCARSVQSGDSQAGFSSVTGTCRSHSGTCRASRSASGSGSPKLTYTLPKRLRSSGRVRSIPMIDSFSLGWPDSSPM